MKLKKGYNVLLEGKPSKEVEVLVDPKVLYLPLRSRRFTFSQVCVKEGQQVVAGDILAEDPANYSVPLLAPRGGTVRLEAVENHIVLEKLDQAGEEAHGPREDAPHVSKKMESVEAKREKLLKYGAWQFFCDAHDGSLPDPSSTPRAIIVSKVQLEPFKARGDVQLRERLTSFTRGLEHLKSLVEYQPIHLVLPDIDTKFANEVRERVRGYAWVKPMEIPLRYPSDNFALQARALGFGREKGSPVWALLAEGVLAVDEVLTSSRPAISRIISLGGPRVKSAKHLKVISGYPLEEILEGRVGPDPIRVINGGVLTGQTIEESQKGLDSECAGLTVLEEQTDREMLSWIRPGSDRRSYCKSFLSSLRRPFRERLTTGVRGEVRACISCGFCEEVCPSGIMPHLIHKLLYHDDLEEAEQARVDLCVGCGMCSYVCTSKIELRKEILDGQARIQEELHAELV
jgi:Na+-transporting NADH:ubiquinone oxidoreductase subunit A